LLTVFFTTVLSLAVFGGLFSLRRRFIDVKKYAVTCGVINTAVYISLWVLVPAIFWRFAVTMEDAGFVAVVLIVGTVIIALQATVPTYLYAKRGLKTPLIGMFVVSWVCGYLFLRVGGESGSVFMLFLWSTMIAPVGVLGIGLLGAIEGFHRANENST